MDYDTNPRSVLPRQWSENGSEQPGEVRAEHPFERRDPASYALSIEGAALQNSRRFVV